MTWPEPVAVFWDFESCTPAPTASGYDVVNNIRNMAHRFGTVTLLKAYLKLSEQSTSIRSELQSSGVSLIDYPGDGPVDKMMLVDMLAYAIDNPPSATILLISADRGFAYAVSVLRLRRYRVVLVVPSVMDVHISLTSQASLVLDCNQDVPRSSMLRNASFSGSHTGLENVEASRLGSPGDKLDNRSESPILTAQSFPATNCQTNRDGRTLNSNGSHAKTRKASSGTSPESATVGTSKRTRSVSSINDKVTSTTLNDTDNAGQPTKQLNRPGSWRAHEDLAGDHQIRTDFKFTSVSPTIGQDWKQKSSNRNTSHAETSSSHETGTWSWPSLFSDKGDLIRITSLANSAPTSSHFPQVVSLGSTGAAESCPGDMPSQSGTQMNLTPSISDITTSLVTPPTKTKRDVESIVEGPSLPTTGASLIEPGNCLGTPSSVDSNRTLNNKDTLIPVAATPAITPNRAADLIFAPGEAVHSSNDRPPILDLFVFRPLVDVLENLRSTGSIMPLRSVVGAQLLLRNKLVYQQAGVVGFGQYIASAEKAGVVTIGGTGGKAWIALHPTLLGSHTPTA